MTLLNNPCVPRSNPVIRDQNLYHNLTDFIVTVSILDSLEVSRRARYYGRKWINAKLAKSEKILFVALASVNDGLYKRPDCGAGREYAEKQQIA